MKFRTEIKVPEYHFGISHEDQTLCVGSCFAEHIGGRLARLKFPSQLNPFGIIYNPVSVANTLERVWSKKYFKETDLVKNQGLWHSFEHHGHFSKAGQSTTLEGLNSALESSHLFLQKTSRLVLTLGTANVFQLRKTGQVVANCHKFPGSDFERRRLNIDEVSEALTPILRQLKTELPRLEVIVTVSPVRHLRDGLVENQKSKATLLLGLEKIAVELPFVHYFPAYEMVLDDLRDYRFFDPDMAHPNPQAVDYIWQHFSDAFFSEKTRTTCQRIDQIVTASEHRPLHPDSNAYRLFLKKQLGLVHEMEKEFPFLNFGKEKKKWGVGG